MKQGSKFKKTALTLTTALGLLGLSGVASAAMYEGCVRPNVELPCEDMGWSFAAAYLFVQPTADGFAYAQELPPLGELGTGTDRIVSNFATGRVNEITPGFNSSGLRLAAAYYYGHGYDAEVNWTRIFQRNTGRDTLGLPIDGRGRDIPGFVPFPTSILGVHGEGSLENDEVNIEWGRKVIYGDKVVARTHFDISYARVKETLDTRTFTFGDDSERNGDDQNHEARHGDPNHFVGDEGFNQISNEESRFNGIGPRIGTDVWYDTGWWNLSFVGHAAGALYVGQIDSKSAIRPFVFDGDHTGEFAHEAGPSVDNFSTRTVVPAAKLWGGVQYNYLFNNNSVLSAEIGYIWAGYFHTIRNPLVASTSDHRLNDFTEDNFNMALVPSPKSAGDIGNFGYHGLYFDFKWRAYT